jgi:PAS domain S-box-containing protein
LSSSKTSQTGPGPLARYGGALLAVALATLAYMGLHPLLGAQRAFSPFFLAALITAWYAGLGPALLALVLGFFAAVYWFVPAEHAGASLARIDPVGRALYLLVGTISIFLSESLRAARQRADLHAAASSQLAAIVSSSEDAITGKTLEGIITSWNPGAERLYGYTAPELLGHPISLLVPPDHPDELPQILARIRRGEHVQEYETVRVRKDGTRLNVSLTVSPTRDAAGHITGAATIARDITERRRLFETLRLLAETGDVLASSLEYQTTLASVAQLAVPRVGDWCSVDVVEDGAIRNLAVAHVDPAKVAWARQLQQRYPSDPHETRGVPQVIRTGRPEIYPDIPDTLLVEAARDAEHLQILRAVGFTSVMIVPLIARGRTLGAISLVSTRPDRHYGPEDLSLAEELAHRAALALDNSRLYQEIQEADRQKDHFLAMLGHELRSPLAALHGVLTLLQRRSDQNPDLERLEARAARQIDRMARLIDDLQDVTRISRGKVSLRRKPLDLVPLVREIVEDQRGAAEEGRLQLTVDLPTTPVLVNGDPIRLTQVLVNLLNNAFKFTDPGGKVTVGCRVWGVGCRVSAKAEQEQEQEPDPTPYTLHPTPYAVVTVRDTGIGIEPAMQKRVFESFMQADPTLDRSRGGLGLGLALVKGLVELHGGEVGVSSPGAGQGTEFIVRLPLAGTGA